MKLLAFSDLHLARSRAADLVAASADADLVIGAGDFCNMRDGLDMAMDLLSGLKAPMVAVPGNAESADELRAAAPPGMTVLHGEGVDVDGLTIFGLGYAVPRTPFGGWSCDMDEAEAETMLAACETADLLVLHSPPKGIAIARIGPKLAVCGHIHDSWGKEGTIGTTRVVNLGPTVNWFEL
mgnify:CR=1 FL=1